jgi:hypothetical protein
MQPRHIKDILKQVAYREHNSCANMFRQLAELSSSSADSKSYYYNTLLPNAIPSMGSSPAPKTVVQAIQSVDPISGQQLLAQPEPDKLFKPVGAEIANKNATCKSATIDQLLASQNKDATVRCGWAYTPPIPLSPIPRLSEGAIGTRNGAFAGMAPTHQRWFWDLAEAKKQIQTDKCKALRSCTDLGTEAANGCGYCLDTNQGVSLGSGQCGTLITDPSACPQPTPVPGPQPQQGICSPDANGNLSAQCLQSLVQQGGCSSQGALALALSDAAPTNYMASASQLQSFQLYQRTARPPINAQIFQQGQATVAQALTEVKQLAANSQQAPTSAIGAAARDLCIQKGAIDQFDFCSEIQDNTPGPFDLGCMQKLFLQLGGQQSGQLYPTASTMQSFYNNFGSWGSVRQALNGLFTQTKSTNFSQQAAALKALYGFVFDLGWMNLPAKFTSLQIAANNTIVGIDTNFNVWRYMTSTGWKQLSGQATQVSVGSDGVIWCIDKNGNAYLWNEVGQAWQQQQGSAILKLVVVNGANVWCYNTQGQIFYWNGLSWAQVQGTISKDIAAGGDGSVFCIGYPVTSGNGQIYAWSGSTWNYMGTGQAAALSAGDAGNIWCVTAANQVFQWNKSTTGWDARSGVAARSVAVGPGGQLVLAIDTNGDIQMWTGSNWIEVAYNA